MNKLTVLEYIEPYAGKLRRLGLQPLTSIGKALLKPIIGNTLTVSLGELNLKGSIEHRGYLWSIKNGTRESFMSDLFKKVVKRNMIFCDIGAFIGYYSLLAAQIVGPHGRVYAFEPDPRNFRFLIENITNNGLSHIITPIQMAVSEKCSDSPFYLCRRDQSRSSLLDWEGKSNAIIVKCITLDKFLSQEQSHVNIIKIDVEGAEVYAINGMDKMIKSQGKLIMFVEYNADMMRKAGVQPEKEVALLKELGAHIMKIDEINKKLINITDNIDDEKYINLFCTFGE